MTLNRYLIEDRNTGRSVTITALTADSARRKAWRHFGYEHVPFTHHTSTTLIVSCLGSITVP